MGAIESVGTHVARLLPGADASTLEHLERAAQQQTFSRRDLLHARGIQLPPFVMLDGHVMTRRVAETGQVRAALIAGPGYFGGIRSISEPDAEALYELVALTDGTWATWDPRFMRELALQDAGLAVGLLDQSSDFAVVLTMRLDERSFENARQRLAVILTRYGKAIFDTSHPVAQRADLAAMIGTSREMMYRALRELEAAGLVKRELSGGIRILDEEGLARLVYGGAPGPRSGPLNPAQSEQGTGERPRSCCYALTLALPSPTGRRPSRSSGFRLSLLPYTPLVSRKQL